MQPTDARHVSLRDSLIGAVLRGSSNVAYHLRECIGEGGQGWVFRANWDDPAGPVVIVKVLRPDVVASEALRRFQREAEVLRMLGAQGRPNPYIVRFYDHAIARVPSPYGPDPITLPFTVLEFVDGTTLEKVLLEREKLGRGLPAERVRRLLRQIAHALEIVHEQKVVHRDLKPSNILLANEAGTEIAKVTDFGLVKLVDVNLQKTTALAGASLGYAPPEQYEQGNQRVSPRTDVFSLAAVVFEMLTAKPAFPFIEGENPLLIVTRILTGPRPSVLKHQATLAVELAKATPLVETLDRELGRALSADPKARHQSVSELWNALEPPLRAAVEEYKSESPVRAVSPFEATARAKDGPAIAPVVRVVDQSQAFGPTQPVPRQDRPIASKSDLALAALADNPAAWTWKTLTGPLGPQALRSVVFSGTGDSAIALGTTGFLRWEHGTWSSIPLPTPAASAAMRSLRWMRDGTVLFFGEGGFVARQIIGGPTAIWRVPDPEITFHGALVEDNGTTTLVGERPYRGAPRAFQAPTAGVLAQFTGDRITVIGDAAGCARLHSVARLTNGQLVACGDTGALVRLELGVVEHVGSICAGNLYAIAALESGGAVTIGGGGHALSISPNLEAQLEAVQTTRDILSLTVVDGSQAWAGSGQARLLRRSTVEGRRTWVRISGDIGITSSIIAVTATSRMVRGIGDDGAVVEGRLA